MFTVKATSLNHSMEDVIKAKSTAALYTSNLCNWLVLFSNDYCYSLDQSDGSLLAQY